MVCGSSPCGSYRQVLGYVSHKSVFKTFKTLSWLAFLLHLPWQTVWRRHSPDVNVISQSRPWVMRLGSLSQARKQNSLWPRALPIPYKQNLNKNCVGKGILAQTTIWQSEFRVFSGLLQIPTILYFQHSSTGNLSFIDWLSFFN